MLSSSSFLGAGPFHLAEPAGRVVDAVPVLACLDAAPSSSGMQDDACLFVLLEVQCLETQWALCTATLPTTRKLVADPILEPAQTIHYQLPDWVVPIERIKGNNPQASSRGGY